MSVEMARPLSEDDHDQKSSLPPIRTLPPTSKEAARMKVQLGTQAFSLGHTPR